MKQNIIFDADLIRRYDLSGPRYTSYPTVARFHTDVTEEDYQRWAQHSNEDPIPRSLSLYFHIPFCDTACFYCACTKVVTKDHTQADEYLKYLHTEIALQARMFDRDRIVEQLHWGGGTPTFLDNEQILELMEITRRNFTLRDDDMGEYSIEIDPRSVDPEKLSVLRKCGFNRVSFGVQDFNPDIQRAINRPQSQEITQAAIESVRMLGFKSVNIDLMYGLPLQTIETFTGTLEQTIALSPDRIAVYNYAHLPARFNPQRLIESSELPSPDEKLDLLQLTIKLLTSAGYVYLGMDQFARSDDELAIAQQNGRLQRNFQGYSTCGNCDVIGMGMSAIGQVCDNYNQNVSDLEQYYARLDENHLPLERGIELEPDDLLRREIILQLMCNFQVDIRALESEWCFSFSYHFGDELEELKLLQADGLLSIDSEMLQVLPAGRLLVRNICMVFDYYLHRNGGGKQFSKVI
ncbi:MAG: oxygen-independent coproporphyrinogen III oxidase [Gammaproteobacteria bacterium]|nr:oxygen-independent coproporphyrinogen III oxidase [Gammaproteobacteria bacterium]